MHARLHDAGVVTGKPIEIGGSLGRVEATGRGVTIVALASAASTWASASQRRAVVVQGFGNVGSIAAKLLARAGLQGRRASPSDYGGDLQPASASIKRVLDYRASEQDRSKASRRATG